MGVLESQADKYLSGVKLYRYHEFAKLYNRDVLDLYALNLSLSQEVLGMIAIFEVVLKNKVHNALKGFNSSYLEPSSKFLEVDTYKNVLVPAKKRILRDTDVPNIIESRLVSKLTLGVWCKLFECDKLWARHLSKIFDKNIRKEKSITLGLVKMRLEAIHMLRNKVAHHERILYCHDIPLEDVVAYITDLTLWMISKEDSEFKSTVEGLLSAKRANICGILQGVEIEK